MPYCLVKPWKRLFLSSFLRLHPVHTILGISPSKKCEMHISILNETAELKHNYMYLDEPFFMRIIIVED